MDWSVDGSDATLLSALALSRTPFRKSELHSQ